MMEVPSTEWRAGDWVEAEALVQAPLAADWQTLPGLVRHTFTHFHFEIAVWAGRAASEDPVDDGLWCPLDRLGEQALPSVMRKIVKHALRGGA